MEALGSGLDDDRAGGGGDGLSGGFAVPSNCSSGASAMELDLGLEIFRGGIGALGHAGEHAKCDCETGRMAA